MFKLASSSWEREKLNLATRLATCDGFFFVLKMRVVSRSVAQRCQREYQDGPRGKTVVCAFVVACGIDH